ncbi:MAG: DUF1275 domain-containing protein [Myxococcales bacterium]|nr:DUF1275 domain-containing protein [Myxococcales bacterium]
MRRYFRKNRKALESKVLAHVLPFVAGTVNASGFFIVGSYTSHVTGSVARVGDDLAQGNREGALAALVLVLSFFLGAVFAAALAERARVRDKSPYSGTLEGEVLTLLAVTGLGLAEPKGLPFLTLVTTALLCAAMGMQNAMVTNLSGAVVRTTHLTGIVTDMGIETVRALRWAWSARRAPGSRGLWHTLLQYRHVPELNMLRLHTAIFVSFLAGAVVGPIGYLRYGYASMLLPIIVLVLLVSFDRSIGFRARRQPPVPEETQGAG